MREKEYQNILWIDDCDDGDSDLADLETESKGRSLEESEHDIEIKEEYFYPYGDKVCLKKRLADALEEIQTNFGMYDLVVFDINLRCGMDNEEFESIKNKLKENRVLVTDKDIDDFLKKAGMYLYLYLLNCGYPSERMIILTGNSIAEPRGFLREAHIYSGKLDKGIIFEKTDVRQKYGWIRDYYQDDYYRVRRLVYDACEFWRKRLQEENTICFNEIYYGQSESAKLEALHFRNMFDRIEMLFPVVRPQNPQSVYYQAMQVAAMFHEESANVERVNRAPYKSVRDYHLAVRYFRNWSAHNKFKLMEMDAEIFALLFCSAFRTYFDGSKEKGACYGEELAYEKRFFENLSEQKDTESLKTSYMDCWMRLYDNLQNRQNKRTKMPYESKNVSELLYNCGFCNFEVNDKLEPRDILLLFLGDWVCRVPSENLKEPVRTADSISYEYCYTYQWNREGIEVETEIEIWKREAYLRYCAYQIFCSIKN